MIIQDLKIKNFRNYDELNLKFNKTVNIIYGKNGQGKSNLLESIYVLGLTKSHRSAIDSYLIKDNKYFSKINSKIITNNTSKKLEIILTKEEKKLKIDNDEVKKISDYISNLSVIIFYPEDLDIIKGGPSIRRKFLNTELSNLENKYYNVLSDYNKILKMKTEYLKSDNIDRNYIEILNKYFIDKALLIYQMRLKFVEKINEYIENIYFDIMKTKGFQIRYEIKDIDSQITIEILKNKIKNIENKEILYKKPLFGPHKDDLKFYLGEKEMISYASQGQQRAAVLAFKLSLIKLYKKIKKETPILLLDDVFSELDKNKKQNLLKYIKNDIQTIITTTELDNINKEIRKNAKLIKIESGKVVNMKEVE